MNTSGTTDKPSAVRGVMAYITGTIAFLTCPCHLPILLLLLSGTAAGSALAANTGTALLVLLTIFALSAYATWRLLDSGEEAPKTRSAGASASGVVREIDRANSRIKIDHGAIPAVGMRHMTMTFRVMDPALLDGVKQGDKVNFEVEQSGRGWTLRSLTASGTSHEYANLSSSGL